MTHLPVPWKGDMYQLNHNIVKETLTWRLWIPKEPKWVSKSLWLFWNSAQCLKFCNMSPVSADENFLWKGSWDFQKALWYPRKGSEALGSPLVTSRAREPPGVHTELESTFCFLDPLHWVRAQFKFVVLEKLFKAISFPCVYAYTETKKGTVF